MTQRLHPSLIRDSDVGTAFKLLMRTLPYAMARFCVLLASATLCLEDIERLSRGVCWFLRSDAKHRLERRHICGQRADHP